jgi:hypothetical protein
MSNPSDRLVYQLPHHFQEDFPRFIEFVQAYYAWLYRNGGFTEAEITYLRGEENWFIDDISKYYETGDLRYIAKGDASLETQAIINASNHKNPGKVATDLMGDYQLDRAFAFFETSDGFALEMADGVDFQAPKTNPSFITSWFSALSFVDPGLVANGVTVDKMLLIRLLKFIYLIKGTAKSIEIFFNIFLNLPVSISDGSLTLFNPKDRIAILDDNFVLDGNIFLRDDDYYNEFTYVIQVYDPSGVSDSVFNNFYLRYIHPSGFKAVLQNTYVPPSTLPNPVNLIDVENGSIYDSFTFDRNSVAYLVDTDRNLKEVGINQPRLSYDPLYATPKGCIFEAQSTNMLLKSNGFDQTVWTKTGGTIVSDTFAGIDGNTTGWKLVEGVGATAKFITQTVAVAIGKVCSFSVFVQAQGRTFVRLSCDSTTFNTSAVNAIFDIQNNLIISKSTQVTAKITPYRDGWCRVDFSATSLNTTPAVMSISLMSNGTTTAYQGNGTSGIHLYGAQFEYGPVTSRIITTTTSETRDDEILTFITDAPWYTAGEGTMTFNLIQPTNLVLGTLAEFLDIQSGSYIRLNIELGTIKFNCSDGRTTTGIPSVPGSVTKIAISWNAAGQFRSAINGNISDVLSAAIFQADNINIGNSSGLTRSIQAVVQDVNYYPVLATNDNLVSFTS